MKNKRTITTDLSKNMNERFMFEALAEAKKAAQIDEVPVGAVVVLDGKIIARGHNQNIALGDPTAHAEILAVQKASKKIKNYRLTGAKLYVTLEPCAMCAGAMVWARMDEVVFGAYDKKAGACGSAVDICGNKKFNHRVKKTGGILEHECAKIIKDFFRKKR